MALRDSYYKSRSRKRRLAKGGPITEEEEARRATIGMGAGMVGGLVDAINSPNQYGRQSTGGMTASGALKGIAAGSALGPIGSIAGGVLGAATGLISGGRARRAEQEMIARRKLQDRLNEQSVMDARIAADPELTTGSLSAQYFALGGKIGGGDKPVPVRSTKGRLTKDQISEFANFSGAPGSAANVNAYNRRLSDYGLKGAERLLAPYSRDISIPENMARVQQHWIGSKTASALARARELNIPANEEAFKANKEVIFGKDRYADTVLRDQDFAKMYPNYMDVVARIYKDRYNQYEPTTTGTVQRANGGPIPVAGGRLRPLSSDGVLVEGNTHREGGVQVPGAEVEDQETIKNRFVYSAQLGFAKKSKPLMRAQGIIEQKPATPERINALKRIEDKENQLAIAQEYIKKKFGLN